MSSSRDSNAAVRLKAVQQHLESKSTPTITLNRQEDPVRPQKYYPKPQPYEAFRPIKVNKKHLSDAQWHVTNLMQTIIVGAGISGVAAAVLLSKKIRNHTVKVYEKNSRVVSLHGNEKRRASQLTIPREVLGQSTNIQGLDAMFHHTHIVITTNSRFLVSLLNGLFQN